jgi:NAD(P)-dependent dehydrogenase (short-subunit alcohol dehydrogenase family)
MTTKHQPACLITGATDGVGKVTALELAKRGFRVVVAARSEEKAEALKQEIRASGCEADYLLGDLASLREVRQLAESFRARHSSLDVLVNNAGVFLPSRTETEDGFETTYQVNYLSHFLLTNLLLEELKRSAQGRIINLSSSVHSVGRFDAANLQSERRFSVLGTYSASKLYMLMFTRELSRRLAGTRVTANAVHPGIVRTRMMLRSPGAFRIVAYLSLPFSVSPEKGARTTLYLATSPEVRGVSGQYFAGSKQRAASNRHDTEEHRALLWELSVRALKLDDVTAPLLRAG